MSAKTPQSPKSPEKIVARIEPSAAPQAREAAGATPEARGAKPSAGAAPAPERLAADHPSEPVPAQPDAFTRVARWFEQTFPHSRYAVLGGLCGLLVAILLFTIGLLDTLIVAVAVTVGVAVGQYLDGDPKLARFVHDLMRRR